MLYEIKRKNSKKYTEKIKFKGGLKVLVPDQDAFADSYIRDHGCSLTAFYMALHFLGSKKSVKKCLSYLKKHRTLGSRSKYSIFQVYDSINELYPGKSSFIENPSKNKIKKALKSGHMILFEEKKPTHTAVYLWNGEKIHRFSNGGHKTVTLNQIINKRSTDSYYKGCVVVRR